MSGSAVKGVTQQVTYPSKCGTDGDSSTVESQLTRNELKLKRIWEQVLGLERVSTGDNFFVLGGDSILAIQVTARAHELGMRFTARQLFESATLKELAALAVDTLAVDVDE